MIRIGKLEITGSFLLLAAWMNYVDRQRILSMALLACALHEFGHIAAIHWVGNDIKQINITVIGAEIIIDGHMGYWKEGVTALAGPGGNLLLALLFSKVEWGLLFSGLNLTLGLFNLLPITPLDGGRALRSTLLLILEPDLVHRIGAFLDFVLIGMLLATGLYVLYNAANGTLLFVGVWLSACRWKAEKKRNSTCHQAWKQVE